MNQTIKWVGILLAGIFGLMVVAGLLVYFIAGARLAVEYIFPVPEIIIPTGPAEIARGQHLVEALAGCQDCHGPDLGGMIINDDALNGRIVAGNLTGGAGGVGGEYTDADWVRAIRHGVGSDGKPLVYVSSKTLYHLSDPDLGAVIAYLKTLPPVNRSLPATVIGILGRAGILIDPSLLPAEVIDHTGPRPERPSSGITADYGRYLTIACRDCHGVNLTGNEGPGGGLDLSPDGDLAVWTEADFIQALRTGVTPDGITLDPNLMPWERIGKLSDDELSAIWLYLQTLTPDPEP
jgi:mono/diheme cytochrome c family protein